jgi:hypothetical protein
VPPGRSAALVLAGLWLGLLVASWIAATASFRGVDRVLGAEARPELQSRLAPVSPADRRPVLRHLASEVNRWMFARLAVVQLALAAGLVLCAWRLGGASRTLALLIAALAVGQTALGPAIASLGRANDFVPRPLPPDVGRRFGLLHGSYVLLDLAKAGGLAALAWLVARAPLK